MATVKKYNLAGLNANVELGKQGSYITGTANSIGFYASGGSLQKLEIANATVATEAVTKAQLDEVAAAVLQYITVEVDAEGALSGNIAEIAAGSRVYSVTVDIPAAWGAPNNTTTFIEVGDSGNASRYIRAGDVDVLKAAQYHNAFQYEYASAENLTYSITRNGPGVTGLASISVVLAGDATLVTDYGTVVTMSDVNSDLGNVAL